MRHQASPEVAPAKSPETAATYAARVPLLHAASAQAGGVLLLLAVAATVPGTAASGDVMSWALLQGIIAAGIGRVLGMEWWWIPIHALFAPGIVWGLRLDLAPAYALLGFGVLAAVYWGVTQTRVPLSLSGEAAMSALLAQLPRERGFTLLDVGSGIGSVLAHIAAQRPDARMHGVEAAPLPYLLSRLRAALGPNHYSVSWGDFRQIDLGRYDVVYAYLSPAAMPELWLKARREMRRGSLFVSNSFGVPGVPPTASAKAGKRARLFLWRM